MVVYKFLFPWNKKMSTNYTYLRKNEQTNLETENNQIKFDNEYMPDS